MSRLRIRTIKPDCWTDERISPLSRDARLLFVVLITFADDDGRFRNLPAQIIGHGYAEDEDVTAGEIVAWMDELEDVGVLVRYEVNEKRYAMFPNWAKHQRVNRHTPSSLPPPHGELSEKTVSDHGELSENARPEYGVGSREGRTASSDESDVDRVFSKWIEATGRTGATVLSPKRRRLIRTGLATYPLADLLDAVQGWRKSPHHRGENKDGTVYNSLELLLRDAEHIERFRDLQRNGNGNGNQPVKLADRIAAEQAHEQRKQQRQDAA